MIWFLDHPFPDVYEIFFFNVEKSVEIFTVQRRELQMALVLGMVVAVSMSHLASRMGTLAQQIRQSWVNTTILLCLVHYPFIYIQG